MKKSHTGGGCDLAITSPPYNCDIAYDDYKDRKTRTDYLGLIAAIAARLMQAIKPGRFVAWNIGVSPNTFHHYHVVELESAGLVFQRQIVWRKVGVPYPIWSTTRKGKRARQYRPNYQHELIEVVRKPGEHKAASTRPCPHCDGVGHFEVPDMTLANEFGVTQLMVKGEEEKGGPIVPLSKYSTDVWTVTQQTATTDLRTVGNKSVGFGVHHRHRVKEHPAVYPAEIIRPLIEFLSARRETVLDPFAGSGTTLIACENQGRYGRGIEMSPAYVATALERMANRGMEPRLVSDTPKRKAKPKAKR